ncbi:MAG: hypothetical protein QGM45_11510 [Anaerolineales bacterium]|nr:hypothetical protein [Anaerolineales bacterium]
MLRMILLTVLALIALSCMPTIKLEAPEPTVTMSLDSAGDAEVWRFGLSEVEAEAANGRTKLLLGASIVVGMSPLDRPAAQIDFAAVDLLDITTYGEAPPLGYGDAVTMFLPEDTLAVGTGAGGATHPSGEGTIIYTSPVSISLEDLAAIASADYVTGRIGYQFRPAFTFRLAPHHLEGMRRLLLRSGASAWLESSRAAADRVAEVPIVVRDSTQDEWNGISEWWLNGPEVPIGKEGLHLAASTKVRVVAGEDSASRCGLRLALRKDEGWTRSDFREDRSGELYQEIQVEVDGTRVPENDLIVYPSDSLEADTQVVPPLVAIHWNPNSAWFLAVVSDASIVRMRIGDSAPFQLSMEAMDLLRALRERTMRYEHPSRSPLEELRAYCWLRTR